MDELICSPVGLDPLVLSSLSLFRQDGCMIPLSPLRCGRAEKVDARAEGVRCRRDRRFPPGVDDAFEEGFHSYGRAVKQGVK